MQKAFKILFVCASLEPGRDGVGDYTRRLAGELSARGHSCWLLALADPHVHATAHSTIAPPIDSGRNATGIPCLRLPASASWAERIDQAKGFRQGAAPDWISWQIVLYGFDPRGLCFGLGRRLREISGDSRSEIMFHEIWIGEVEPSPLKNKLIGKIQKLIIKDLLQKLRPQVIHTHTPLYQYLLGTLGYPTMRLPLFGNIPVTSRPRDEWLKEKWPQGWREFGMAERDSWWIFIMFGSIHPEWDAEDFVRQASRKAQRAGKKCALIFIGRIGAAGEEKLRLLRQHEGDSWRFLNLGPQSEEDISQSLLTADFGVTAVPPENLFKSGTAAAMLEHGLGVIATRPLSRYRNCPPEKLTIEMRNVVTDFDLEVLKKTKPGSLLPEVARQFIDDLPSA